MSRTASSIDNKTRHFLVHKRQEKQRKEEKKHGYKSRVLQLQEIVLQRSVTATEKSRHIGMLREEIVQRACKEIEDEYIKEEKFFYFTQTKKYGFADVVCGIDFYIVAVVRGVRTVFQINVTGPQWAREKRTRHPENFVISIPLYYPCDAQCIQNLVAETKKRILKIIT